MRWGGAFVAFCVMAAPAAAISEEQAVALPVHHLLRGQGLARAGLPASRRRSRGPVCAVPGASAAIGGGSAVLKEGGEDAAAA